jgi:hypothetical protein
MDKSPRAPSRIKTLRLPRLLSLSRPRIPKFSERLHRTTPWPPSPRGPSPALGPLPPRSRTTSRRRRLPSPPPTSPTSPPPPPPRSPRRRRPSPSPSATSTPASSSRRAPAGRRCPSPYPPAPASAPRRSSRTPAMAAGAAKGDVARTSRAAADLDLRHQEALREEGQDGRIRRGLVGLSR